jgi:hypothetical protein
MRKIHDLTGRKFGRWTVIRQSGLKNHQTTWLCKCECGTERVLVRSTLRSGGSKSCGCYRSEISTERIKKEQCAFHLPKGEAAMNRVLHQYKVHAKKRGYEFKLTREKFRELTQKPCHYCGAAPSNVSRNKNLKVDTGDFVYSGIDRKDNSIGYFIDNVVPCCKVCNRAKDTMSYEEYLLFVNRSYEHLNSRK